MQNSFCAREEKECEGVDFHGTYVPALSVGNVLRVAPYDMFSGNDSSCKYEPLISTKIFLWFNVRTFKARFYCGVMHVPTTETGMRFLSIKIIHFWG